MIAEMRLAMIVGAAVAVVVVGVVPVAGAVAFDCEKNSTGSHWPEPGLVGSAPEATETEGAEDETEDETEGTEVEADEVGTAD